MKNTVENNYFFPPEILKIIFEYVDLHTLVFRCRHVCRLWRDTVECPALWKTKIFCAQGHKFATDSALSKAHLDYPWYICYALCRDIFNRNLFLHSKEIPGSPWFWRDADSPGFICQAEFYPDVLGYAATPQQLLDDGGNTCFLCAPGDCSINHSVDLYAEGLTREIMEFQPPIHISEWFATRFFYTGVCHIEVKLFNSAWQCCIQNGYYRAQHRMGRRQWEKVSHTFKNYSPDVRYVVLHHGVDTWKRPFERRVTRLDNRGAAAKIVGTKLFVALPDPNGPSVSSSSDSSLQLSINNSY